MTTCQTLTIDFDNEMANTRKLLERVPLDDAHRDFKPHQKSMSLAQLATHVAEAPAHIHDAISMDVYEMPADFNPHVASSTAELLEIFDKSVAKSRAAIDSAQDDQLGKIWMFKFAGQTVFSAPRAAVIRVFQNHVLHHRAQLGVYLRLNSIAIPGMYGPSADEPVVTSTAA